MMERDRWIAQIEAATSLEELERVKAELLGKNGVLSGALRELAKISPDERRTRGQALNVVKEELLEAFSCRKEELEEAQWKKALASETLDVTLPSPAHRSGRFHPLMQVISDITEIFASMGFQVREGPDIETDFYNFTALKVPEHHPSRAEQDTFYFGNDRQILLRTQTSAVQIRAMQAEGVPIKIIVPGRVYRPDPPDATHSPMFHQIEGLMVGPDIHMGHLKGCLETFCQLFFGRAMSIRFRPSFFPFVEPGAEVDVPCRKTAGKLEIGVGDDWLELLGCGMVHPEVFRSCGIDPEGIQGFAWGMGVERCAMVKYGIDSVRHFFANDQRWLRRRGFSISQPGL